MPGSKPAIPHVEPLHKAALEALIRRHTTPQQLVLRAKIVLFANQGLNNHEIARKLEVTTCMVRQWRRRWIEWEKVDLGGEKIDIGEEQDEKNRAKEPMVCPKFNRAKEPENKQEAQEPEKIVRQRLADAPRPGAPAKISPEEYCQIMALACQRPEELDRPIAQWSSRELADEAIDKGIVQTISPRQVGRFLKRSRC